MISNLEALHAAARPMPAVQIFSFIPVTPRWRRQPLALERKQGLVLRVPTSIDPNHLSRGRGDKIDRAASHHLVRLFHAELEVVPPPELSACTVEQGAELSGEDGLRRSFRRQWVVAPQRQSVSDEGYQN